MSEESENDKMKQEFKVTDTESVQEELRHAHDCECLACEKINFLRLQISITKGLLSTKVGFIKEQEIKKKLELYEDAIYMMQLNASEEHVKMVMDYVVSSLRRGIQERLHEAKDDLSFSRQCVRNWDNEEGADLGDYRDYKEDVQEAGRNVKALEEEMKRFDSGKSTFSVSNPENGDYFRPQKRAKIVNGAGEEQPQLVVPIITEKASEEEILPVNYSGYVLYTLYKLREICRHVNYKEYKEKDKKKKRWLHKPFPENDFFGACLPKEEEEEEEEKPSDLKIFSDTLPKFIYALVKSRIISNAKRVSKEVQIRWAILLRKRLWLMHQSEQQLLYKIALIEDQQSSNAKNNNKMEELLKELYKLKTEHSDLTSKMSKIKRRLILLDKLIERDIPMPLPFMSKIKQVNQEDVKMFFDFFFTFLKDK